MAEPTVNAVATTPARTMGGGERAVRTMAPVLSMGYEIGKELLNGNSLTGAATTAYDKQNKVYEENKDQIVENYENAKKEYKEYCEEHPVLGFFAGGALAKILFGWK